MEAPQVIRLASGQSSFLMHLTYKPTARVVDASSEVEVDESDVDEPSAYRVRSICTTHSMASMWQSISTTGRLSTNREFVECAGIDVQLAVTKDEIRGCLRLKLENPSRD